VKIISLLTTDTMRGGLVGCTGVVEARRYLGPSHSSLLAVLPRGRASRAIQVVKSTLKCLYSPSPSCNKSNLPGFGPVILVTFKDYLTKTMTQEGSRSISLDVPCTKPKTCVNCRSVPVLASTIQSDIEKAEKDCRRRAHFESALNSRLIP
jgi:hypothetical protein